MGWGSWTKNDDGTESKTKTEKDSSGSVSTHHLVSDKGGDRENHSHVIVTEKPDCRKIAHCIPHKNNR